MDEFICLLIAGGAYIPPARLRQMQAQIQDKSSVAYQRIAWEALKKSINGLVNKVKLLKEFSGFSPGGDA